MAKSKKVPMKVIKKRSAKEWMEGNNVMILRGLAMQCLTYENLAASIGVTKQTLDNWRNKHPEIADAIELGRNEANGIIFAHTFDQAINGSEKAMELFWRYRIAPTLEKEESEDATEPIHLVLDRVKKGRKPGGDKT